jgi:hemerythrin-like domain-containing protein
VPEYVFHGIADFFGTFADRCHHGKEETLLFLKLQELGMPYQGRPIRQMLLEHEEGRGYVRAFTKALERLSAHDPKAKLELIRVGRAYASLLKEHIFKENHILYPMGSKLLNSEDDTWLFEAFERLETERIGEGVHEGFHRFLEELKSWSKGIKEELDSSVDYGE